MNIPLLQEVIQNSTSSNIIENPISNIKYGWIIFFISSVIVLLEIGKFTIFAYFEKFKSKVYFISYQIGLIIFQIFIFSLFIFKFNKDPFEEIVKAQGSVHFFFILGLLLAAVSYNTLTAYFINRIFKKKDDEKNILENNIEDDSCLEEIVYQKDSFSNPSRIIIGEPKPVQMKYNHIEMVPMNLNNQYHIEKVEDDIFGNEAPVYNSLVTVKNTNDESFYKRLDCLSIINYSLILSANLIIITGFLYSIFKYKNTTFLFYIRNVLFVELVINIMIDIVLIIKNMKDRYK